MAVLNSRDVMMLAMAAQMMRNSARTMDGAHLSLEDVRREALEFIGGNTDTTKSQAAPMGQFERLDTMEKNVNTLIDAALSRKLTT